MVETLTEDRSPDVLLAEVELFRQSIQTMLVSLPVSSRLACADTVLVLDQALQDLQLRCAGTAMEVPDELARQLRSTLDRLQVPVAHFLSAPSRAERTRQLADLIRRVRENAGIMRSIAAMADRDATVVLDEWRVHSAEQVLELVGGQIDEKLRTLDRAIGEARSEKERRAERFDVEMADYTRQVDQWRDGADNDADALLNQHRTLVDGVKKRIEKLQRRSEKLLKHIADGTLTNSYGVAEERERTAADRWRLFAVVVALLGVIPLVLELFLGHGGWQPLATSLRVGITVAIGAVASYAAKQSGDHRRNARIQHGKGAKMRALEAWIESLPPEQQDELRKEFARIFFQDSDPAVDDPTASTINLVPSERLARLIDRFPARDREPDQKPK
ncbi:hypothetical protein [Amycolatopsis lexingtonensis]|uniref:hypothetical protein n=1 Tax=Amycolatopsis lexingtonensis TaxID=218822 RepID=UPI003F6ECA6D